METVSGLLNVDSTVNYRCFEMFVHFLRVPHGLRIKRLMLLQDFSSHRFN